MPRELPTLVNMAWAETHDVLFLRLPDGTTKRFGSAKMNGVPLLVHAEEGAVPSATVAGAGSPGVNGIYSARGTFGGKTFFNLEGHATSSTLYAIKWVGSPLARWYITDGTGTAMYLSTDNVAYPWLATFIGGADPQAVVTANDPEFDIGNYEGFLMRASSVKQTLTQAADKVTVEIQNVDRAIGLTLNEVATSLTGAKAVFAKAFRQSNGMWATSPLVYGEIDDVRVDQENATITVISDTAPNLSFLTNRPLQKTCPLAFKGEACGYVGAETTCNKKRDDAGGCSGRNNVHRFGGFIADGELSRPIVGTGFGDEFDPDRQRDRDNPRIPFGGRYQLPLDSPYTGF